MANAANITGWIAYAAARGDTVVNDAASQAALQRAIDFIQYRYIANLLPGYDDTLSVVEPATYEAAKIELATAGFFSGTYTPDQRKVMTKVEGIAWTPVGGGKGGIEDAMPTSTLIQAMFDPYLADNRAPSFSLMAVGQHMRA